MSDHKPEVVGAAGHSFNFGPAHDRIAVVESEFMLRVHMEHPQELGFARVKLGNTQLRIPVQEVDFGKPDTSEEALANLNNLPPGVVVACGHIALRAYSDSSDVTTNARLVMPGDFIITSRQTAPKQLHIVDAYATWLLHPVKNPERPANIPTPALGRIDLSSEEPWDLKSCGYDMYIQTDDDLLHPIPRCPELSLLIDEIGREDSRESPPIISGYIRGIAGLTQILGQLKDNPRTLFLVESKLLGYIHAHLKPELAAHFVCGGGTVRDKQTNSLLPAIKTLTYFGPTVVDTTLRLGF